MKGVPVGIHLGWFLGWVSLGGVSVRYSCEVSSVGVPFSGGSFPPSLELVSVGVLLVMVPL